MKTCVCGKNNNPHHNFCPHCGLRLLVKCTKCKDKEPLEFRKKGLCLKEVRHLKESFDKKNIVFNWFYFILLILIVPVVTVMTVYGFYSGHSFGTDIRVFTYIGLSMITGFWLDSLQQKILIKQFTEVYPIEAKLIELND